MELAKRLREERIKNNYNQPELAKILNVTKQTVSNWENNNRVPDVLTLEKLADLYDCSVDYLLGRTNERKGILNEFNIDGENIIIEVSKDVYPNGLTKDEVIKRLKIIKQMEDIGFVFPEVEQE